VDSAAPLIILNGRIFFTPPSPIPLLLSTAMIPRSLALARNCKGLSTKFQSSSEPAVNLNPNILLSVTDLLSLFQLSKPLPHFGTSHQHADLNTAEESLPWRRNDPKMTSKVTMVQ
jgi:hypothetical protein